jgi:hypothetical protein
MASSATAGEVISFRTGGMMRFPNTQLPSDDGNAMFEGWLKGSALLHKGRGELSVGLRVHHLADSAKFPFNNSTTTGIELAYHLPVGKRASTTLKLRHDWQKQQGGTHRQGNRLLVDYFFMDYKVPGAGARWLGRPVQAKILKIFGTLTYPETLVPGDDNVTVQVGLDRSVNLSMTASPWKISPFVGANLVVDRAGHGYNNKLQPSVGVRWKYPVPGGDIHLGLRYQGDFRWKTQRYYDGPGLFVGWYSAF